MINADLLKKLLSCLDAPSFTKFIWQLWEKENKSTDLSYVKLAKLPYKDNIAFEQTTIEYEGVERKNQGYNLIIPFYEPLELFINPYKNDLFENSNINQILKKYGKVSRERRNTWNYCVDGNYIIPIVAFVTNFSGFNEEFYQENILPKLDTLVKKAKLYAQTKIGTCDSFIELDLNKTSEAFSDFISGAKSLVIRTKDGIPIVNEYQSEKYLVSGVLKESHNLINPVFSFANFSNSILKEFSELLSNALKERELELFIKKYYRDLFGSHYDRIETQVWLNFPELDINSKDRRLDIFLRNSVENDWELLELKHINKPIKFNQDIPVFTSRLYSAIEQLKNYGSLLKQDKVKRKLSEKGIDYCEPELKLVINKKPSIDVNQWRTLKGNTENGIKIITMEDVFSEMKIRYQNQFLLLNQT